MFMQINVLTVYGIKYLFRRKYLKSFSQAGWERGQFSSTVSARFFPFLFQKRRKKNPKVAINFPPGEERERKGRGSEKGKGKEDKI